MSLRGQTETWGVHLAQAGEGPPGLNPGWWCVCVCVCVCVLLELDIGPTGLSTVPLLVRSSGGWKTGGGVSEGKRHITISHNLDRHITVTVQS